MKIKLAGLLIMTMAIFSFSSCSKKGCTDPNSFAYGGEKVKKDDESCTYPSAVKKSIVFKTTATWCPMCGDWGKEYADDLASDHGSSNVTIQIHVNDAMSCDEGDALKAVIDASGSGVPHFFVGSESMSNSYYVINAAVEDELSKAVDVSMEIQKQTLGSAMNVKVQSKWNGSTAGTYYLAVYVLEDGIVAQQSIAGSPSDPDWVHNHILRKEASGGAFGKAITITEDGNLEEFGIALNSSWVPANCYPVAVLWRYDGTQYEFVNLAM